MDKLTIEQIKKLLRKYGNKDSSTTTDKVVIKKPIRRIIRKNKIIPTNINKFADIPDDVYLILLSHLNSKDCLSLLSTNKELNTLYLREGFKNNQEFINKIRSNREDKMRKYYIHCSEYDRIYFKWNLNNHYWTNEEQIDDMKGEFNWKEELVISSGKSKLFAIITPNLIKSKNYYGVDIIEKVDIYITQDKEIKIIIDNKKIVNIQSNVNNTDNNSFYKNLTTFNDISFSNNTFSLIPHNSQKYFVVFYNKIIIFESKNLIYNKYIKTVYLPIFDKTNMLVKFIDINNSNDDKIILVDIKYGQKKTKFQIDLTDADDVKILSV